MGWGPADGRGAHAPILRLRLARLALATTGLIAGFAPVAAQTIDVLSPVRDGFLTPQQSPLRRTAAAGDTDDAVPSPSLPDPNNAPRSRSNDSKAPSRNGQVPTYGLPAARETSGSG